MPNEEIIQEIENLLSEVVELGGANEQSKLVPNLQVINASPTGLTGFVIVSDARDGDNILAKKVGSVIYTNGDLVNVLFPDGGEAIAFQQGSQSATTGDIWEIVPSTTTDIFYDKGNVAINNSSPDALLHVGTGTTAPVSASGDGLHVDNSLEPKATFQDTTNNAEMGISMLAVGGGDSLGKVGTTDSWPFAFTVNNLEVGRFDTSGRLGVAQDTPTRRIHSLVDDSATAIGANADQAGLAIENDDSTANNWGTIEFLASNGNVATIIGTQYSAHASQTGSIAFGTRNNIGTFGERMRITGGTLNGWIGMNTTAPDARLETVEGTGSPQLRLAYTHGSVYCNFTVDSNHDITIQPSSTGQVIFSPTLDSTDFFQVLDANGGTPILNVDSIDEYVHIGDTGRNFAASKLEASNAGTAAINVNAYSTTSTFAGMPFISLLKSHDATLGTLTATVDTERLGDLLINGVDSNNAIRTTAGFRCIQNGAAGAGSVPSDLAFVAANNTEIMRMTNNQRLVIGNTVASAKLHVDQASSTAAIPVLYLDQADVSEEMIEFNTTIGVGNAIEAVGGKSFTLTHFIKVTIPGGLTRYLEVGTIA